MFHQGEQSLKGKFHDHFFLRKAQNLRAEKVLGMRIEILIFSSEKIALRQWVELFSTHWRNKKAKPIKLKHLYKKKPRKFFKIIFQNQNKMEDNTQPEQNCVDLLAAA